jgi:pyruvate/2-oxoglutarate dehydrogenase complex dihydrolipoamide dehydrogenase (E3) component
MTQDSAQPGRPGGPDVQQDIMPDLCVIGSDAVALSTAAAAAAFGVSVVLGENGETGGVQRDGGALLSKALLAAAAHVNAMRTGAHFGVKTVRFGVDFDAVRAHVRDALEAVAPLQSRERLKALGVSVITGAARFVDRKTLAVEGLEIKARRFVIATGSLPALPAIAGSPDAAFHLRQYSRPCRMSAPSHCHWRRPRRPRNGASISAAWRRSHRARSG